ncbi:DNA-binding response OmpR family regulator [Ruminiclostridium sufflavum DSM 19573]|uniref:Stage 0 sporulation protein A homolog n=1 Tax=Ruminiclostridium sufflavum DSM 19573 TaxID=1121337 RepID=A0A318XMJ1_9FIRM|nr:response regulator transcription factor [Ruminiclostridium sufflavum]PYG87779.1 DNA-binding response OmpR family regulator [Ruminiclostridium sufflavum DSM 19573]
MNILLVEDDGPLAMGIEYALKKQGFLISIAKSIKEAHSLFNVATDLILLDVTLPDGNGYDFCKKIRLTSDVPIIFMTALDDEPNVVFGLDIGGDDYIAKPVRTSELVSRINALMRRSRSNSGTCGTVFLTSGNIVVEPLKCKVSVNGEEVYLTAAEYKLLLVLLENKGKVLSRNVIVEKLWDIDGNFVDYNTLNVYMKRLREKIETEEYKHIETVRGMGYMWKNEVDEP